MYGMKKIGMLATMATAMMAMGDSPALSGLGGGGSWVKTNMTPKMKWARRKAKYARKARKTERQHRKH